MRPPNLPILHSTPFDATYGWGCSRTDGSSARLVGGAWPLAAALAWPIARGCSAAAFGRRGCNVAGLLILASETEQWPMDRLIKRSGEINSWGGFRWIGQPNFRCSSCFGPELVEHGLKVIPVARGREGQQFVSLAEVDRGC